MKFAFSCSLFIVGGLMRGVWWIYESWPTVLVGCWRSTCRNYSIFLIEFVSTGKSNVFTYSQVKERGPLIMSANGFILILGPEVAKCLLGKTFHINRK